MIIYKTENTSVYNCRVYKMILYKTINTSVYNYRAEYFNYRKTSNITHIFLHKISIKVGGAYYT